MDSTNDSPVCVAVRKGPRPSRRFQQDHLERNGQVKSSLGDSAGEAYVKGAARRARVVL